MKEVFEEAFLTLGKFTDSQRSVPQLIQSAGSNSSVASSPVSSGLEWWSSNEILKTNKEKFYLIKISSAVGQDAWIIVSKPRRVCYDTFVVNMGYSIKILPCIQQLFWLQESFKKDNLYWFTVLQTGESALSFSNFLQQLNIFTPKKCARLLSKFSVQLLQLF